MSYQQPPNYPQGYPQQPNTQYQPWQGQQTYQQPPQAMPPPNFQSYPPMMPPQMPQQPPKKKSKVGLIVGIVVGLVLLSCIAVYAAISSAAKNTTTGTIISSPSTQSTTPSTTNQIAKVGQTITVEGVASTLASVKTLAPSEFVKPKPGNQFIVAHVKIVNNGSTEQSYTPFDFHVRSGSGNITDEEVIPPQTYTANNLLNSGKLSSGGTVEGDIVFQVPKGDHKAQMTWQPSFFGNAGDNAWNLGL